MIFFNELSKKVEVMKFSAYRSMFVAEQLPFVFYSCIINTSYCLALLVLFAAPVRAANPPSILSISSEGPGNVSFSQDTSHPGFYSAKIGRWDAPYPGSYSPNLEPTGADTLVVNIAVNDGGLIKFDYEYETYDSGIYDWIDASLTTPSGTISILTNVGKPGSDYGQYWHGSRVSIVQTLREDLKDKTVSLRISVRQDGYGDQTHALISGLSVSSNACATIPLTPITGNIAKQQEIESKTKPFLDTDSVGYTMLTSEMRTAVEGFRFLLAPRVLNITSGYRDPEYQGHFREVWDKFQALPTLVTPDCADIVAEIRKEYREHGLGVSSARPASPSAGFHPKGMAIDASSRSISPYTRTDFKANAATLWRPFPGSTDTHAWVNVNPMKSDPIHYELQGTR